MTGAAQSGWSFAIPGDLTTPSGGYIYDARVTDAAQGRLTPLRLPDGFPAPTKRDLETAHATLMAAGPSLIDGLAFGALPAEMIAALPYRPVALCHHPLGLETGLAPATRDRLIATETRALARASHVIVTSDATKRSLSASFGLSEADITVATPGIDRSPITAGSTPPLLLTIASLTRRKGHDVLLSALSSLIDLKWQAVWIGSTDRDEVWHQHVLDQRAALSLEDRVDIRGAASDSAVNAAYQTADVFVLPSRYEGYGMVFDEAMMRGMPVIACAAGAVPDVVPADAGHLVPIDDAPALAAAIRDILTMTENRSKMAVAARQHALTLSTWDDTWKTIHTVLRGHL